MKTVYLLGFTGIGAALTAVAAAALGAPPTPLAADLLIRGGTVYTGDLHDGVIEDVAVTGDRISFVGHAASGAIRAARTIDATGLIVAPGFIDAHVHSEEILGSDDPQVRANIRNITQGVTTNITGVDGAGTPETAELLARYGRIGVGTNVATYVGFGNIRQKVLGMQGRAPTDAELGTMKAMAAKGMCGGAIGLSTGLFYSPQSYATTDEVIAVAKEAAVRGGIYDSHQRDEGNGGPGSIGIVASVAELIRISKEAGLPGHFAHLKNSGVLSWGQSKEVIALVEAARAAGQEITADQYPFLASGGSVTSILIPRWAQIGGRTATLQRFDDPATAPRLRGEMEKFLAGRGGGKNLLIIAAKSRWMGKTLADVAVTLGKTELDTAEQLFREGDVEMAIFAIGKDDLRAYMTRPWVMSGSDGTVSQRMTGAYPMIYQNYVIDEKLISMAQFVRRSSAVPAETFRLADRGYLKRGYFADVVVFDPKAYRPMFSYTELNRLSEGVRLVLVNGKIALDGGKPTGALAGRPLPHAPKPGTCTIS